jgi:DNA-binding CsgD family transcriptional regulator
MSNLPLSGAELTGIRRLLSIDEAADDRQRWRALAFSVEALIPCDQIGIGVTDATGCLEYGFSVPNSDEDMDPQVCDGPLPVGIQHLATFPHDDEDMDELRKWGLRDTVRVGAALGQGRVVQLYLDRRSVVFDERDVALLRMLEPFLCRVMRPVPRAAALQVLSTSEHRVLAMVAAGGSNHDVARQLMVSEATVRKPLEHAYRKLGVANRTAAAALVHATAVG